MDQREQAKRRLSDYDFDDDDLEWRQGSSQGTASTQRDSDDDYLVTSQADKDTKRKTEAKGYEQFQIKTNRKKMRGIKIWENIKKQVIKKENDKNSNLDNRRLRGRAADEAIRKAKRGTTKEEVEVVIDDSSEDDDRVGLCVRVVFKDPNMTEKLLYTFIGNEVPVV